MGDEIKYVKSISCREYTLKLVCFTRQTVWTFSVKESNTSFVVGKRQACITKRARPWGKSMKRFKVLVPTDYSEGAELALEHGLYLTRKFEGDLHVLNVAELPTIIIPDFPTEIFDMARDQSLLEMKAALEEFGDDLPPIRRVVLPGIPSKPAADVIVEYAKEAEIDFIVMGTHGRRGPRRLLLGSVTEEVVRRSPCPVFTVRNMKKSWPLPIIDKIAVPIDFSERSKQVLGVASMFAEHYGASLTLVHVIGVDFYPFYGFAVDPIKQIEANMRTSSEKKLKAMVSELQGAGITSDWCTISGHPAREIATFADLNDIDLIVIGSHGRAGFERMMLGSVSEKILRSAHCPVTVVNTSGDAVQMGIAA